MNRKYFIYDQIKKIFKKDMKISPEDIFNIYKNIPGLKYYPKSISEVKSILIEIEVDIDLDIDLDPSDKNEEILIKNSDEIEIICSKCYMLVNYGPKKGIFGFDKKNNKFYGDNKRRHKACKHCNENFEFNAMQQTKLLHITQNKKPIDLAIDLNLKKTDLLILNVLGRETGNPIDLTQAKISKKIKKSVSTVSRRLKKLIALQLIQIVKNRISNFNSINFYRLNETYIQKQKAKLIEQDPSMINIVSTHHFPVQFPILQGNENIKAQFFIDNPDVNKVELIPMGPTENPSWYRYNVFINGLCLQFFKKVMICFPYGYGEYAEEALENTKQKANKIKGYLEDHFNFKIGPLKFTKPEEGGKKGAHYVNERITQSIFDLCKDVNINWGDSSHLGGTETGHKVFADTVRDIIPNVINNQEDIMLLKQNQTICKAGELKQDLNEIKQIIKEGNEEMKGYKESISLAIVEAIQKGFNPIQVQPLIQKSPNLDTNYFL